MRIVLAGPDGVGKSTFGKKLAKKLNLNFIEGNTHKTKNKFEVAKEQMEMDDVIFDRFFFPDHIVYSQVKNHSLSAKELNKWIQFIDIFLEKNVVILYIDALDSDLKARLEDRGDEYIEWHEIEAIRNSYREILEYMELNGIPVIDIRSLNDFNYVLMLE